MANLNRNKKLAYFINDRNSIFIKDIDSFLESFKSNFFKKPLGKKNDERWIFRGAKTSSLQTELEKCFSEKDSKENISKFEERVIRKFERQLHHYNVFVPPNADKGYLLSLMRHYGAPVRLMDWTYSFFVAAYFSLNRPKKDNEKYMVWAIEEKWLSRTAQHNIIFPDNCLKTYTKKIKNNPDKFTFKNPDFFNQVYFKKIPIAFVHGYNPFYLNERLVIQQGLFLCPGDVTKSFEENLVAVFKQDENNVKKKFKQIVFDIDNKMREKILEVLLRMNINQATLFPGLQGFSESLSLYSNFPDIIIAESEELCKSYEEYVCNKRKEQLIRECLKT